MSKVQGPAQKGLGPWTSDLGLDWGLLKRVSRSFYLTLRLLPGEVRESIALAYLLARLTDTLADGAATDGEKELLARQGEIRAQLEKSPDREAIRVVWQTIQEGQRFDRERFAAPGSPPLSEEELDRYTYLVAGCVGEFWTKLCAQKLASFSRRPVSEMTDLGILFGKGLQLVNILRDRHADAQLGRVYVPPERLEATLALARGYLRGAERYVKSVKNHRVRAACALPLLLAVGTLDLVQRTPEAFRPKVSRVRVWWLLARALLFRERTHGLDAPLQR